VGSARHHQLQRGTQKEKGRRRGSEKEERARATERAKEKESGTVWHYRAAKVSTTIASIDRLKTYTGGAEATAWTADVWIAGELVDGDGSAGAGWGWGVGWAGACEELELELELELEAGDWTGAGVPPMVASWNKLSWAPSTKPYLSL
jgi:hypothetical protein